MKASKADFFISYTKVDEQWAEWIAWVLEEAGYHVVFQKWDFRRSRNFFAEIRGAIDNSERMIAVLSRDYLQSEYARAEFDAIRAKDPNGERGLLLPVAVREFELAGLDKQIGWLDLRGKEESDARKNLIDGVKGNRTKPLTKPAFPGLSRVQPQNRAKPRTKPDFPVPEEDVVVPASQASTPWHRISLSESGSSIVLPEVTSASGVEAPQEDAETIFSRGQDHLKAGFAEQAITEFTLCLQIRADVWMSRFFRAQAEIQLHQYGQAIDDLNTIFERHQACRFLRASAYFASGCRNKSPEDFRRALDDCEAVSTKPVGEVLALRAKIKKALHRRYSWDERQAGKAKVTKVPDVPSWSEFEKEEERLRKRKLAYEEAIAKQIDACGRCLAINPKRCSKTKCKTCMVCHPDHACPTPGLSWYAFR